MDIKFSHQASKIIIFAIHNDLQDLLYIIQGCTTSGIGSNISMQCVTISLSITGTTAY